ncbi:MAG: enoyl-CoA hydratase/isomerase family protein [Alphaproteobacteria bacterium]|nr:enoyl-CoA hydratase/isomerase family protein [Alphaproteobacteria bacterium]
MSGTIHVSSGDRGVIVVTLDSPPMNPLGERMRARFIDILDEVTTTSDFRVLVITGRGKAFCSGDDLKSSSIASSGTAGFGQLLERLDQLPQPIVGAINGWCIGGGFELALCCDIRVASDEAQFVCAGVNMGLMASAYRLPRLIGEARAKAMLLTGLPVDATTAERYGLVTAAHPANDLLPSALQLAQRIASRAPLSVEATKSLAGRASDLSREEAGTIQKSVVTRLRESEDHREAVAAFREKRDPVFQKR